MTYRSALALVCISALALSGCAGSSTTATPPATTTAGTTTTAPASGSDAMRISGFAYNPSPLTVAPGAKVDVSNSDSATHTVTSDMAGLFKADDVKQGTPVTFTAPSRAGTYTFHCDYHPSMHGTLVVT